jgi:hypothetical protein
MISYISEPEIPAGKASRAIAFPRQRDRDTSGYLAQDSGFPVTHSRNSIKNCIH